MDIICKYKIQRKGVPVIKIYLIFAISNLISIAA